MSDQVVRGSYALHFQLSFLREIGILGIKQLEESIGGDTNQSAPGRVGMVWAASLYYAVVDLVLAVLTNGWPVCDVKLSLVSISGPVKERGWMNSLPACLVGRARAASSNRPQTKDRREYRYPTSS